MASSPLRCIPFEVITSTVLGWPYADGSIAGVDGWAVDNGGWSTAAELLDYTGTTGVDNLAVKPVTVPVAARIVDLTFDMRFSVAGNTVDFFVFLLTGAGAGIALLSISATPFAFAAAVGDDGGTSAAVPFTTVPFQRDTVHLRYTGDLVSLWIAGVLIATYAVTGHTPGDVAQVQLYALRSDQANPRVRELSNLVLTATE